MSTIQPKVILSEIEYLETERNALEKSEYYQGECFAMAGASRRHNILTLNMATSLNLHLQDHPCQPYATDMRLYIKEHQHYVYPDVLVVCHESAYADEDMVEDATVIVEVLSPATESYDRGKKFLHYQSLTSFQEYVLMSQEAIQVEVFHRKQKNEWSYQALTKPEDQLILDSIQFSCLLSEMYRSVPFVESSVS